MDKARKKELGFQFWKVENKEEALFLIKQNAYGFLLIAGIHLILGFFFSWAAFIDGAIFLVFALLMLFQKSRVAAVLLLLASIFGLIVTIMNKLGVTFGGRNVFLALMVLYFAVSSVYVTFKYHEMSKATKKQLEL